MATSHLPSVGPTHAPAPIEAVLFDLHSTLVDQGDARSWLEAAWQDAGRSGTPEDVLSEADLGRAADILRHIWTHATRVDPTSRRDVDSVVHREVFKQTLAEVNFPIADPELIDALHRTTINPWRAYRDTVPVLQGVRDRGRRSAVLSNIGVDARPVLRREGIIDLVDEVVFSYEVGAVKPDPQIFALACERLKTAPERTLMVGDNWRDDAGAADLGCRVLILPRTHSASHGLDQVLALLDAPTAQGSDQGATGLS